MTLGTDKNGNNVEILVDFPRFMNNPVEDLESLLPIEYDDEGRSVFNKEPNLNGLFPNKDLVKKLNELKV